MIPGIWNCQICDWKCDGSHPNKLMTHLHDVHGIKRRNSERGGDFGDYLKDYFQVPKCCCGCGRDVNLHRRDFAYSCFARECSSINRLRNPSCIEFYLYQGMEVDDAIIALSSRQKGIAERYSTDELKKLLRECNSGARNPASIKSIQKRTGKPKSEIKKELSKKSCGSNNGFHGRGHTDKTKRVSARTRSLQSKIVTKPELAMWGMLYSFEFDFEFEFLIDKYCVDFCLFDNIVIEVYGDYWHSDRFVCNDGRMNKKEKDEIRKNDLEALGYVVHVFWESEIMKTPKEAFLRLKGIIEDVENNNRT